jgi:hypothetical protein
MSLKSLFALIVIFISTNTHILAQKTVRVETNNGQITVLEYNQKFEKSVLDVNKYIDLTKPINIIYGNSRSIVSASELQDGWFPFDRLYSSGEAPLRRMLKLIMIHDSLKISCEINAFDETNIAVIKDNKIIKHKTSDISFHITNRFMEVIDQYGIPVFQIELDKKQNAIIIGGAFNYNTIYFIIWRGDRVTFSTFGEKLLMSQPEYNEMLNRYLRAARTLKPISE